MKLLADGAAIHAGLCCKGSSEGGGAQGGDGGLPTPEETMIGVMLAWKRPFYRSAIEAGAQVATKHNLNIIAMICAEAHLTHKYEHARIQSCNNM